MPLERLDRNDAKVLLIWILAGILGACVAYTFFFRAFPEASVEFKVPRADALTAAEQFEVVVILPLFSSGSPPTATWTDTSVLHATPRSRRLIDLQGHRDTLIRSLRFDCGGLTGLTSTRSRIAWFSHARNPTQIPKGTGACVATQVVLFLSESEGMRMHAFLHFWGKERGFHRTSEPRAQGSNPSGCI